MIEAHKSRKMTKSTANQLLTDKATASQLRKGKVTFYFVCSILTSTNYRVVSWFSRGLVVLAWSRKSSRLAALRCRNASGGNWRRQRTQPQRDAAVTRHSRPRWKSGVRSNKRHLQRQDKTVLEDADEVCNKWKWTF